MPGYDGAGNFVRSYNWTADAANAIPILASRFDTEDNGFAAGLSNAICRDGQSTISANIPFNNKKITGLGDATAAQDAMNQESCDARYPQLSSGSFPCTLTGFASGQTGTISWRLVGTRVFLDLAADIIATSTTNAMTMTGIPVNLQPSVDRFLLCTHATNASGFQQVEAKISGATITFYVWATSSSASAIGFSASGNKGLTAGWQGSYSL